MPSTLTIHPWPDPVIDTLGYDPRSRYVETFWLPTLGPTALQLTKQRFRELTQPGFDAALVAAKKIQKKAYASGEPQAAMRRFFDARASRSRS